MHQKTDQIFTLASFNTPFGSQVAIQPSLQPGTSHRLDIDPMVITGTISPKTPIGIKGVFPNVKWSYTSSAIIIMPSFRAVSAICSFQVLEIRITYKKGSTQVKVKIPTLAK